MLRSSVLGGGPQAVQAARAAELLSMSGYSKNHEYVYGKWIVAHLTSLEAHLPWVGRLNPALAHVRTISTFD